MVKIIRNKRDKNGNVVKRIRNLKIKKNGGREIETNNKVNDEGIHLKEILEDEVCERLIEKAQKNAVKKKKEIVISCSCRNIE